jgi:hypothetical protein
MLPPLTALVILDSQNIGANPATGPQETTSILMTLPIMLAQVSTIINLTMRDLIRLNPSIILNKISGLFRRKD